MANTPVSGLRYAALTDLPNANTLSQNLATDLDHVVIPKYSSTAARDLANVTPVEGDKCHVTGDADYEYSGSSWYPLQMVKGWTTYTPTWTTTSGLHVPTIGNGVYTCAYLQLGKIVFLEFQVIFGSTTNFGSGATNVDNWAWSLPIAPVAGTQGALMFVLDPTTATSTSAWGQINLSSQLIMSVSSGAVNGSTIANVGNIDSITPFVWASGGRITGGGFYPVA